MSNYYKTHVAVTEKLTIIANLPTLSQSWN